MIAVLTIAGVCLIIVQIIFGIMTGSFILAVSSIISGVVFALILLALSQVLENQQEIFYKLDSLNSVVKDPPQKITCRKCGETYTDDRTSCPYCGVKTSADN